jgi:hypothetical protein
MTRYIFALALLPVVVFPQSKQQSPSTLTTYTSDALGFSYTYPLQLIPNTGDFRRKLTTHVSDQPTSSVLFSAFETPVPGKPREGVVITAEDVGVYGGGTIQGKPRDRRDVPWFSGLGYQREAGLSIIRGALFRTASLWGARGRKSFVRVE